MNVASTEGKAKNPSKSVRMNKTTRFLLDEWKRQNPTKQKPSKEEIHALEKATGFTRKQIRDYFVRQKVSQKATIQSSKQPPFQDIPLAQRSFYDPVYMMPRAPYPVTYGPWQPLPYDYFSVQSLSNSMHNVQRFQPSHFMLNRSFFDWNVIPPQAVFPVQPQFHFPHFLSDENTLPSPLQFKQPMNNKNNNQLPLLNSNFKENKNVDNEKLEPLTTPIL